MTNPFMVSEPKNPSPTYISFELHYHIHTQLAYTLFRAFGCHVFLYLWLSGLMFKGYSSLDLLTSPVYITCHTRFNEDAFPFPNDTQTKLISTLEFST